MSDLVIRRARLGDRSVDVRVSAGRVAEVVDARPSSAGGDVELDAGGGWILPGLHDHHLHLRALIAARASVAAGPPAVTSGRQLQSALARASGAAPHGWIRAVGYHESVAGDLDRRILDLWVPDRPVRVQHRSGVLWVLNSRALEVVGAGSDPAPGIERDRSGRPTGRLWRMDEWLSKKTAWLAGADLSSGLSEMSREAAALGVTGWTDATPGRTDAEATLLRDSVVRGDVLQRLHLMIRPRGASDVGGDPAGSPRDRGALVTTGAVKVILDDFDLPPLESLSGAIRAAHAERRPVAIHCVTRTQLVLALAALEEAGGPLPGDRIEHGAVIPPELIPSLKMGGGLIVVTQPNFVFERGDDYLHTVEPDELANLWRAASLSAAGVTVAAGTDAPFGRENPWDAMRAATTRRTASGASLGMAERVDARQAFGWFCGTGPQPGRRRRVAPGEPADLVVVEQPLEEVVAAGGRPPVSLALVAGEVVYA